MQFAVWPGTQQPWSDILEVARHADAVHGMHTVPADVVTEVRSRIVELA